MKLILLLSILFVTGCSVPQEQNCPCPQHEAVECKCVVECKDDVCILKDCVCKQCKCSHKEGKNE